MKKLFFLFIVHLLLSCFAILHGQNTISYMSEGELQEFNISHDEYYITFSSVYSQELQNSTHFNTYTTILDTSAIVTLSNYNPHSFEDASLFLKELFKDKISSVDVVLRYKNEVVQLNTNEIIVKINSTDILDNFNINEHYEVVSHEFVENVYICKFIATTTFDIFNIVNKLNENGHVEYAEPNFLLLVKSMDITPQLSVNNDPLLVHQWAINNTGQFGGTPGADMSVQSAWSIAHGLGIKVAVLDLGVQLDHPDLINNLLSGYDATGGGSMGACDNNAHNNHGTLCAGVIVATFNNIGIKGIAYQSKVIPIRIGYRVNPSDDFFISSTIWKVNAFMWAKNQGADVISCSWASGSNTGSLNNVITDCVTNGRGGKGIPVLFASGNSNNSSISYPALHPKVIAVGASTMCDERKHPSSCDNEGWGSNYGEGLSVVAPGVKIYTTNNNSNYLIASGTSLACPNVAAVAALILSLKPNYTQNQVRYIIESTANKIQSYSYNYQTWGTYPNGTWSHQAGYGRVNAFQCLLVAGGYQNYGYEQTLLQSNTLNTIYSNPTSDSNITITYKINNGNTAYLLVTDIHDVSTTFPLLEIDVDNEEFIMDISSYSSGVYSLSLIVDGQIEDSKTLIKQ